MNLNYVKFSATFIYLIIYFLSPSSAFLKLGLSTMNIYIFIYRMT